MSSKIVSYFDWDRSINPPVPTSGFNTSAKLKSTKKTNLNSIGMSDDDFKQQLKKWKNRNF